MTIARLGRAQCYVCQPSTAPHHRKAAAPYAAPPRTLTVCKLMAPQPEAQCQSASTVTTKCKHWFAAGAGLAACREVCGAGTGCSAAATATASMPPRRSLLALPATALWTGVGNAVHISGGAHLQELGAKCLGYQGQVSFSASAPTRAWTPRNAQPHAPHGKRASLVQHGRAHVCTMPHSPSGRRSAAGWPRRCWAPLFLHQGPQSAPAGAGQRMAGMQHAWKLPVSTDKFRLVCMCQGKAAGSH